MIGARQCSVIFSATRGWHSFTAIHVWYNLLLAEPNACAILAQDSQDVYLLLVTTKPPEIVAATPAWIKTNGFKGSHSYFHTILAIVFAMLPSKIDTTSVADVNTLALPPVPLPESPGQISP